jgi:hypothetical protein
MHGSLDIRRNTNLQSDIQVYQVRYEDLEGNSFSASMNKEDLRELLYEKLALDLSDEQLDAEYDRLSREGHIIFPEIELRDNELAGAGLQYLPSEG